MKGIVLFFSENLSFNYFVCCYVLASYLIESLKNKRFF